NAPIPAACLAGSGDLLSRALAHGAGARRHHGAEDASLDVLGLTRSPAPRTAGRVGARRAAVPTTRLALPERVDGELLLDPEDRLPEREDDRHEEVVAPAGARASARGAPAPTQPATEEHVEDIAHVPEREEVARSGLRAEEIVLAPLGGVGERLVRR